MKKNKQKKPQKIKTKRWSWAWAIYNLTWVFVFMTPQGGDVLLRKTTLEVSASQTLSVLHAEEKAVALLYFAVCILLGECDHQKQACNGIHHPESFRNFFFLHPLGSKKSFRLFSRREINDRTSDLQTWVEMGQYLPLRFNCTQTVYTSFQFACNIKHIAPLDVWTFSPFTWFHLESLSPWQPTQPNVQLW